MHLFVHQVSCSRVRYVQHAFTQLEWAQGLELDSNGKLVGRPRGAELQQIREEQEGWGASSEKASHAFLENLAVTGAKAAGNAGLYIVKRQNRNNETIHLLALLRDAGLSDCDDTQIAFHAISKLGTYLT